MTKTRLPILAETRAARLALAGSYETQLRDGGSITCKKGCSNCCHHPVYITIVEGATIYLWLREKGLWTTPLREALEQNAQQTRGLAAEVWALSELPCPLLSDQGLCQAYGARPFTCRVTFSRGPAEECRLSRLGSGVLPKTALLKESYDLEMAALQRQGLKPITLPLASAVLYGAKIASGELGLQDLPAEILENEYVRG